MRTQTADYRSSATARGFDQPGTAANESATRPGTWRARRVSLLEIALFASQLRAMVGAGIAINEALGLLARASRAQSAALAVALEAIRCDIEEGHTLAYAFRRREDVFGRLPVEMIATGEATGTLEATLGEIADDCEQRHRSRASFASALIEPALIVVTGVVVSYILLTVTVPQFKTLYEAFTRTGVLPLPTRLVMSTSDALLSDVGIASCVLLVSLAVALTFAVRRNVKLRYKVHAAMLRIPMLGELVLMDSVARASRTIAVVYRSIGEIPLGLELARQTVPNLVIAEAFTSIREDVCDGRMVWEAMRDCGDLPEVAVFMTKSGEETGQLDTMLAKLAETFETRVKYLQERLLAALRYGLLLMMGGFVMCLLLAMYLPMFSLIEQMKR
ncbi:MAG TPA: type II secretion system F family protein [Blastocatellia bacterium]|nr:type II secretion system F family protein [Blastocatellia bacterium]